MHVRLLSVTRHNRRKATPEHTDPTTPIGALMPVGKEPTRSLIGDFGWRAERAGTMN